MNTAVSAFSVTDVKTLIDARLSDYCKVRVQSAQHVGERYVLLWTAIDTLLQSGGKRLRPYMLLMAFDAFAPEEPIEAIMPAALAQEMIHTAMLIHDDIIDRDTIRYGVKNISGQYNDAYKPYIKESSDLEHMTTASALLAGDVLLSDSYRLMSRVERPHEIVTQAVSILSNGVFDVVGGELLDTESSFIPDLDISVETIARFKTASYSFVSPLTMGATLANAPAEQIALLRHFAEVVGIAYQLKDDLLGVFGNEKQTGKSASNDIKEGKKTLLIEQLKQCGTPQQQAEFFAIFHDPNASDAQIEVARTILRESGAKVRVDERINELRERAEHIIDQLDINEAAKQSFSELLAVCVTRNS